METATRNTAIEPIVQNEPSTESYFDGNTWQLIGYRLLSFLVCTVTLGIAYPWMLCVVQNWEIKHTVINGRRLRFDGRGHQIIGRYLLWTLLTIVTFGIYGIWFGLGMKRWVVKHTFYADEPEPTESYFSGGAGGYFGVNLLAFLFSLVTFGIGRAWAEVRVLRWEAKHTHIGGSPLVFTGSGGKLFVKYLVLALLTPITLGIYALFFAVSYKRWEIKSTAARYMTPEIQDRAKEQALAADRDFAKYRIAANDLETAAIKSGFTGDEDPSDLRKKADEGNMFAEYRLATVLKGGADIYEGEAEELLRKSADAGNPPALTDLSKQSPSEEAVPMLMRAAEGGSAEASFLLAREYRKTGELQRAAYWFKTALEWGYPEAVKSTDEYESLITDIALMLSEGGGENNDGLGGKDGGSVQPRSGKKSKALPIVLGVVGGIILLGAAGFALVKFGGLPFLQNKRPSEIVDTQLRVYPAVSVKAVDARNIKGKEYTVTGEDGSEYTVVIGEKCYYDADEGILYFQFGALDDGAPLYLSGNGRWATLVIEGSGWFKALCPDPENSVYAAMGVNVKEIGGYDPDRSYLRIDTVFVTGSDGERWFTEKLSELENGGKGDNKDGNESGTKGDGRGDASDAEQAADIVRKGLVGEWTCAEIRFESRGDGQDEEQLHITYLTLRADGSFSYTPVYYVNVGHDAPADSPYTPDNGTIWGIPPMGFPTSYGNYTYHDNGVLTLDFTGDDVGGAYSQRKEYNVLNFNGNGFCLNGLQYYKGNNLSVSEVCDRFGIKK